MSKESFAQECTCHFGVRAGVGGVYLTVYLGHLQRMQKFRVGGSQGSAFGFFIFFFVFNLERKQKVSCEQESNCHRRDSDCNKLEENNSGGGKPLISLTPRRRLKYCGVYSVNSHYFSSRLAGIALQPFLIHL